MNLLKKSATPQRRNGPPMGWCPWVFGIVISLLMFQNIAAGSVTVKVGGMRSSKGYLAMSVFAKGSKAAFPGDSSQALRTFYVPLDGKTEVTVPMVEIEEGDYAISVMHDEEADHKMHFNLVGIPVEGFGFSNNPRVYFGPPSFERAKIHVGQESGTFEIKMKYFL